MKTDALRTAAEQIAADRGSLMQVQYGSAAAADVVATAMQEMSQDTNLGHASVHAHWMALQLTEMLAGVKHPGFKEEHEWRVVVAFESESPGSEEFRSTPMAIVPYIKIPLPMDAIASIRVGPGRHVDVREAGLRRLLKKAGCKAPVQHSDVPLRT